MAVYPALFSFFLPLSCFLSFFLSFFLLSQTPTPLLAYVRSITYGSSIVFLVVIVNILFLSTLPSIERMFSSLPGSITDRGQIFVLYEVVAVSHLIKTSSLLELPATTDSLLKRASFAHRYVYETRGSAHS